MLAQTVQVITERGALSSGAPSEPWWVYALVAVGLVAYFLFVLFWIGWRPGFKNYPIFYRMWCWVTGVLEAHRRMTTTARGSKNRRAYERGRRLGKWLLRKS